MLSSHYLQHDTLRPVSELWPELLPFLSIRNDAVAVRAVEEYLVYLENPQLADKQYLGIQIDDALARVDTFDRRVAALLYNPGSMFDSRWMALLSYQTLLRVRRAVELYDGRAPHPSRPTFWHGMPAFPGDSRAFGETAPAFAE
jgi:hypothetical protein